MVGEARIRELLKRKRELFETLLSCARDLSALTYQDHEPEYDAILEKRETCIERIKKTEVMLMEQVGDTVRLPFHIREDWDAVNAGIRELVGAIQAIDEENQARLQQELTETGEKLQAFRLGKKGTNGYTALNKMRPYGAYIDGKK